MLAELKKSATSVASLIAGGREKGGATNFIHNLSKAKSTAAELKSQLIIFREIGYLAEGEYLEFDDRINRISAMLAGLIVVGSYFVTSLARVIDDLKTVAKLSPLNYYQGGEAMEDMNVAWAVTLLVIAALFAVLAWWRFERRDIRVAGEGAWQRTTLSSLSSRLPRRSSRRGPVTASEGAAGQG